MIPTQFNSRLQELYHHWFRAEEAIKTFERLDGRVVMPSVQELRYAGRRLAQVLAMCDKRNGAPTAVDIEELETHLIEAIQNCIKARHDALDASVHFIHKRINQLIGAVGLLEVRANFPNFNLLEDEIKAIDRKIIQTRADRGKLDGNYDAILVEHSEKLLKFYKELESSELAIRQALLAQKQRNRRNLWIASGVGFLLGIVGSVIASNLDRWIVSTSEKQQKTPATAPSPSLKQP